MDIWQAIANGFCTGLGTGAANWLLIKRLESIENKALEKFKGSKAK